jgi:hypothetical protein
VTKLPEPSQLFIRERPELVAIAREIPFDRLLRRHPRKVVSHLRLRINDIRPNHATNRRMTLNQVYPAKLTTDILAAIVSLYFLWQHELLIGLLTHFLPPPIASFLVIRLADLNPYKNSLLGAYLVR